MRDRFRDLLLFCIYLSDRTRFTFSTSAPIPSSATTSLAVPLVGSPGSELAVRHRMLAVGYTVSMFLLLPTLVMGIALLV